MVAPRIIWRYILRETVVHTAIGLAAIALLLVVGNVLRFLEDMVGTGVGLGAVAQLMRIILPSYFSYAIPTALVFGILLTFGRMSLDGEIIALRASGISVRRLLPPVLALGLGAALLSGWILAEAEPRSRASLKQLVRELGKSVRLLEEGRFRRFNDEVVAYVHARGDESCPLRGVLLGEFSDRDRPLYIQARCGEVSDDTTDPGTLGIELREGTIHTSEAQGERYRRVAFESMHLAIDISAQITRRSRAKDYTTLELLALEPRAAAGEAVAISGAEPLREIWIQLHRRVAFPLASVVLAIVAVPLGIRPLRSGRSAGALTAVGVVSAYWLLTSFGERAAEDGLLPPSIGAWLPSVIVLLIGLTLVRRSMRIDA